MNLVIESDGFGLMGSDFLFEIGDHREIKLQQLWQAVTKFKLKVGYLLFKGLHGFLHFVRFVAKEAGRVCRFTGSGFNVFIKEHGDQFIGHFLCNVW